MVSVVSIGTNPTPIWGITNRERTRRIAAALPPTAARPSMETAILANDDFVIEPLLLTFLQDRKPTAILNEGTPVLASAATAQQRAAIEAAMLGQSKLIDPSIELVDADADFTLYNRRLRKRVRPTVMLLKPSSVRAIERATYASAYKGVTDILTKYLWPEWALVLTRLAAKLGLSPNLVTFIGFANCIAATVCFWNGLHWAGMAFALAFMVLDTVDGKLARCTITSSKLGSRLDHGVDRVHPPFWWWAWAHGLAAWGLALSPLTFAVTMVAIVGGYVVQRMIERYFIRSFGFHIHVWRRVDSQFRLITARRNPKMVILFAATILQRPDLGIVAVACWTILSLVFHAVQLVQAESRRASGIHLHSWLCDAEETVLDARVKAPAPRPAPPRHDPAP